MTTFAWVRARNTAGKRPDPQPVIYQKPLVGSRMDIAFEIDLDLSAHLTLDELAERYPAPRVDRLKMES